MPGVYGSVDQSGSGVRVSYLNEVADFLCDAVRFSTSLQEFLSRRSLLSQGYCFYAGLCERGLSRGFRGVYRSLLWHVPFTVNPPLFLRPLRVNGMGGGGGGAPPPPPPPRPPPGGGGGGTPPTRRRAAGAAFLTPAAGERHGGRFARPPCPPGIALKTAATRYAPLRLHLADRAGLDVPVSTDPLTTVMAVSPGCAPAFPPVHLSRRKQSRAEPHVNGIFHRTHAPKYENYFRANHRLPASPWSTINKKKLATLSGQHDVRRRVFCLQDRT